MAKRSDDRSAEGVAGDGGFHAHDHDHCIETALGDAESVCIERGVRLTVLRKRVLEIVWQSHRPLGAYAILDVLAADGRRAAPPTVYRALDFLQENGLVHRIASMNAFVGCPMPDRRHRPPPFRLFSASGAHLMRARAGRARGAARPRARGLAARARRCQRRVVERRFPWRGQRDRG